MRFTASWRAFGDWQCEAYHREKCQAGRTSLVSYCSKLQKDPDLNSAPPRLYLTLPTNNALGADRGTPATTADPPDGKPPAKEEHSSSSDTTKPAPFSHHSSSGPSFSRRGHKSTPSSHHSPSKTRNGTTYQTDDKVASSSDHSEEEEEERVAEEEKYTFQAPVVEVAGADGPIFVHRPWTFQEIKESMVHLPNLHEVGDKKLGEELLHFCREFRPTTHEFRRFLLVKLGSDWAKASLRWL